jgi:hypothetical protein
LQHLIAPPTLPAMPIRIPRELRSFAQLRPDVEAVLQRCGIGTYDLLLIDSRGVWTRWVFTSEEDAVGTAQALDVPLHTGWNDRMVRRMQRADPWNTPEGRRRAL